MHCHALSTSGARFVRKHIARLAPYKPIVPFEIIDVAESLAEKEGSAAGETKDKAKRQDYQDLAALLHSQAATIDSFHGREDLHPDGACAAEIKSLCPAEEMDTTHVSNLKFTSVGGEAKAT